MKSTDTPFLPRRLFESSPLRKKHLSSAHAARTSHRALRALRA
jgi:hypothetical protein